MPGNAEHDALERGGDRARVGDVVAEVGAVVDAGDDQVGLEVVDQPERRRAARSRPASRRTRSRPSRRRTAPPATHSGRRNEIERAVAERLPSGAITASSMSSSSTSARRSACRPSASMPSSLVSSTRSIRRIDSTDGQGREPSPPHLWSPVMARTPGWPCAVLLVAGVSLLMLGGLALYGRARRPRRARRSPTARPATLRVRTRCRTRSATRIAEREIGEARSCAPRRPGARGRHRRRRRGSAASRREFHAGARRCTTRCSPTARCRRRSRSPAPARELRAAVAGRSRAAARLLPPRRTRSCCSSVAARLENAAASTPRRPRAAPGRRWPARAARPASCCWSPAARRAPTRRRGLRAARRSGSRSPAARPSRRPRSAARVGALDLRHQPRRRRGRHDLGRLPRRPAARGAWPPARSGVIAAAVFEPGARGAWRPRVDARPWHRRAAPPPGWRAPPASLVLAALLLWMPEVPLDLALVTRRRACWSSARAAEVVRVVPPVIDPVAVARSAACGRLPGMDCPRRLVGIAVPDERPLAGRIVGVDVHRRRDRHDAAAAAAGRRRRGPHADAPDRHRRVRLGPAAALRMVTGATRPGWVIHAAVALGGLATAVATHDTGGANSPARFWPMLVLVFAAYFFPPREAWPYLALVLALHALPLAYDPDALEQRAARRAADPRARATGCWRFLLITGKRGMIELRARADELARTDPLTGPREPARADRGDGRPGDAARRVGLLMLDVDDFKHVNTVFGHPGGDRALVFVADCLRKQLPRRRRGRAARRRRVRGPGPRRRPRPGWRRSPSGCSSAVRARQLGADQRRLGDRLGGADAAARRRRGARRGQARRQGPRAQLRRS